MTTLAPQKILRYKLFPPDAFKIHQRVYVSLKYEKRCCMNFIIFSCSFRVSNFDVCFSDWFRDMICAEESSCKTAFNKITKDMSILAFLVTTFSGLVSYCY
jgi:hypothetical protein